MPKLDLKTLILHMPRERSWMALGLALGFAAYAAELVDSRMKLISIAFAAVGCIDLYIAWLLVKNLLPISADGGWSVSTISKAVQSGPIRPVGLLRLFAGCFLLAKVMLISGFLSGCIVAYTMWRIA